MVDGLVVLVSLCRIKTLPLLFVDLKNFLFCLACEKGYGYLGES